ncbi:MULTISPECIES: NAD-dependent malic enzyme [Psychrobacter]|jgi:malate dehydrogenase (oxaloacetate-decarboxylating)|uniref:NAD-dependent malic enzyme n=2 Tax=Psychrobacter TaxID=497 RepID=A0A0T6DUW3_9GAMM|nr:NAD-dependent malic enzyme [Psychrobacter sp. PSP]AOY43073.1 malate dehydrogenase [Psychrobacter sp. AntiMn-1]KRU23494.1 NAD-dependent malic enzyme [Psychrobacter piscatorii]MBZ1392941.1 NAD-dependent malic enzyme [Psychrobacter pacificensis]MED6315985.1 NAD-dependent malic enzyme [Pseudomonadota bacterium]OLF37964.1 NAD-dependent malic enzyme [Psychrobacter sp. C 20.9]HBD03361.1 NAD-dependent malic enzyme [Psychrobacter sp.]|tara:strand:- start:51 stop:1733 length:1683 start_codon:yes stop_codon:yes gene_type:complete
MSNKRPLYIPVAGPALLETPLLNKGSAFSAEERNSFNLTGLLPHNIETIEEQSLRAYHQLRSFTSDMDKHIYLRNIQDTNETLFYHLVEQHIEEIMPLIYTPTVGQACEKFSQIYRRKRGLFVSYAERHQIDDILQNATKQNVKVIVVTDGERILGLGDQGIGGMGIPIGKLSLYTACGGISPAYCLPILLDVGTNNQQLLDDPMYMGWRNPRISGDEYNEFVDLFIQAVKRRWPEALLQFEDFAQENATPLLNKYRDQLCCFNDDIQGTAAVSVGTLIAACLNKGQKLSEQKIAFLGAGSAGCGIAEHIVRQMQREGLTEAQARSQVFMVDRYGLLTDSMTELQKFQVPLVQKESDIAHWDKSNKLGLAQVVQQGGVTVLFGVSGQKGLFTQEVIEALCANTEHPIVLPLSNPTTRVEATPQEVMNWSRGKAIIATGSPFPPTTFNGQTFEVSQCNNSYIFPGIGLGVLAAQATSISDNMLMAASQALADISMEYQKAPGAILPPIKVIREISEKIAYAVAVQAVEDKLALPDTAENLQRRIEANFWLPEYRHYRRTSF